MIFRDIQGLKPIQISSNLMNCRKLQQQAIAYRQ